MAGALESGALLGLSLARYRGSEADLQRLLIRPVLLTAGPHLSFTWRYRTRDITKNLPTAEASTLIDSVLGRDFGSATLTTRTQIAELGFSKRGRPLFRVSSRPTQHDVDPSDAQLDRADAGAAGEGSHNRQRHRSLTADRPFLQRLGVTDDRGQVIPAMARKWRQIDKFIEVFVGAWRTAGLDAAGRDGERPLSVVDFGAGKGYLTFALYDHLVNQFGRTVSMIGVERRPDLVAFCNQAAADLGFTGLAFRQGDIDGFAAEQAAEVGTPSAVVPSPTSPTTLDVMIALHACDTATDDALFQGVRAGASILICSPCCHKELRPQLLAPHPLRPILQHGIHLGQQAEMLTDGLRALLLQANGYDARVFEFVSLEHTSKNKMILATRRTVPLDKAPLREQIDALKTFYGVREQRLETLLGARSSAAQPGP